MTATQVIWLLFIGMMVNFAGMRYFWLRSEKAEEENKKLKAANAQLEKECLILSKEGVKLSVQNKSLREENEVLKVEIERKDRLLAEWEKHAPFLAAHGVFEMKEE